MQTDYNTYESLRAILEKVTPILIAQIRALYRELDKKFHLQGAKVPITFGFDRDSLGSYNQNGHGQKEHFHFSLFFIGYAVNNPLSKEDRMDLYKHEYAHYMRYNMPIPKQYQWQPGIHGSAWKYCCSLIGAAPTPYYKAGEALMNHNYEKTLRNPIHDKTVTIRDQHRREQEYRRTQNVIIKYEKRGKRRSSKIWRRNHRKNRATSVLCESSYSLWGRNESDRSEMASSDKIQKRK